LLITSATTSWSFVVLLGVTDLLGAEDCVLLFLIKDLLSLFAVILGLFEVYGDVAHTTLPTRVASSALGVALTAFTVHALALHNDIIRVLVDF